MSPRLEAIVFIDTVRRRSQEIESMPASGAQRAGSSTSVPR
jgi:hypothetical protein